jgi:hypothetical protein
MITISEPKALSIVTAKLQPYKLVKAMRDVFAANADVYTIQRSEQDPVSAVLLASSVFNSLVDSLNPTKSLPLKIKFLELPSEAAAKRFEEVYNLVLSKSELSLQSGNLVKYGFQHKIDVEGQSEDFEVESHLAAAGGVVTSNYPIQPGSVSAFALPSMAALTVNSEVDALGQVTLYQAGSPVATGASVQLVYQTTDYLAYMIQDEASLGNEAVVISQALYSYLLANQ